MVESQPYNRISVHHALGGGSVADVLLWKRRCGSIVLLVSATIFWWLFDRAGYNLLSFASHVLLLLVVILFLWAKSASLLNRPLPPLPDLQVSESSVMWIADVMQECANHALSIGHEIAIERNFKLFLQSAVALCLISYFGNLFDFLTLIYIVILLSLSAPVLYEKYQSLIDAKLCMIHRTLQMQYRKFDASILSKAPIRSKIQKKIQ